MCNFIFEEPQRIVDKHYEVPSPNEEYFYICPYCGSDSFKEMDEIEGDDFVF